MNPARSDPLTVVGTELVVSGSSRPRSDVVGAGIEPDTLALRRGVQTLAEVLGRHNVQKRLGCVGCLLDAVAFGCLKQRRSDVQVTAVLSGGQGLLYRRSGYIPPQIRVRLTKGEEF